MKKLTLIIVLVLFGTYSYSQEAKNNRITQEDLHKVEKKNQETSSSSQAKNFKSWTLEDCKSYLEALDAKEAKIKSDPEQMKIAQEEGWFEKAEKNRKQVKARIEELK